MSTSEHLSATDLNTLASGDEMTVVELCNHELEAEFVKYPDYMAHLEDIDIDVCTRGELIEAIRMAPTMALRQMVFRVYSFRQNLVMVTGRSFT